MFSTARRDTAAMRRMAEVRDRWWGPASRGEVSVRHGLAVAALAVLAAEGTLVVLEAPPLHGMLAGLSAAGGAGDGHAHRHDGGAGGQ